MNCAEHFGQPVEADRAFWSVGENMQQCEKCLWSEQM